MNCEEIRELLISQLSGEIDPDSETILKQHLEDCASCRENHLEFTSILGLVRQMPPRGWDEKLHIKELLRRDQKWRAIVFSKAAIWMLALTAAITALAFSPVQWQLTSSGFSIQWGSAQPQESQVATELKSLREQIVRMQQQTDHWRNASDVRIKQLLDQNNLEQQKRYWQTLEMYTNYLQLQHKADVQKIQHDIGTIYNRTGQEVEKTNELLEYVLRTSASESDIYAGD